MDIGAITKAGGVSPTNKSSLTGSTPADLLDKKAGEIRVFVTKPRGSSPFTGGVKMEIVSVLTDGTLTINLSLVPVELKDGTIAETLPDDIRVARNASVNTSTLDATPAQVTLGKDESVRFSFRAPGTTGNHYVMYRLFNRENKLQIAPTGFAAGVVIIE